MQNGIKRYTNIEPESQFIICNNLLLTSIVDPNDEIGSYEVKMDDKNPLICINLNDRLEMPDDLNFMSGKFNFKYNQKVLFKYLSLLFIYRN